MKLRLLATALLLLSACATAPKPLTTAAEIHRSNIQLRWEARAILFVVSVGCLGYCDETTAYLRYVIDSTKEPTPQLRSTIQKEKK